MNLRAMQEINAQRSARWMAGSPGWTTLEIAGELAGEVGELANVCKKLRRSEMGVPGNKVSDEDLLVQARGEIADVFIVLALTASKLGIDLQDAVRVTFNAKSEQMGFPERLVDGAAPGSWQKLAMESLRFLTADQLKIACERAGVDRHVCTTEDEIARVMIEGVPLVADQSIKTDANNCPDHRGQGCGWCHIAGALV